MNFVVSMSFIVDEITTGLPSFEYHLGSNKWMLLFEQVNNPERFEFRPKEMLRDLCAIFALFASAQKFQLECAKSDKCNPSEIRSAIKTCQKFNLLTGESMNAFESLPELIEKELVAVKDEQELLADAPEDFLDPVTYAFMMDPVILPSTVVVERSTAERFLLNGEIDPYNREKMTKDDIKPATDLKQRIDQWLEEKRAARSSKASS